MQYKGALKQKIESSVVYSKLEFNRVLCFSWTPRSPDVCSDAYFQRNAKLLSKIYERVHNPRSVFRYSPLCINSLILDITRLTFKLLFTFVRILHVFFLSWRLKFKIHKYVSIQYFLIRKQELLIMKALAIF
jgi:hypothetical protein